MYKRDGSLNCSPRSSGRKLIRGHFSGAACILLFLTVRYTVYIYKYTLYGIYIQTNMPQLLPVFLTSYYAVYGVYLKAVFLSCPRLQEALYVHYTLCLRSIYLLFLRWPCLQEATLTPVVMPILASSNYNFHAQFVRKINLTYY